MDQENIMFIENDDKSHTMVDLYLNDRFRVLNKRIIIPPQLKAKNFYNELNTFANNNRAMFIYNDDKEISRKCREIWNKIIELIGINKLIDFVNVDDDVGEFITADVHENTSFVIEDNYRYGHNNVVIVLHSVINDYLKTSLVQHRY